jgi:hypothetical protein
MTHHGPPMRDGPGHEHDDGALGNARHQYPAAAAIAIARTNEVRP